MSHRFGVEMTFASRELTRLCDDVTHADAIAISPKLLARSRSAANRAATYVWLASVLERVVRDALQSTMREISSLAIPTNQIRVSLFALLCDADFAAIAGRNRAASWEVKAKVFARVFGDSPVTMSEDVLPLDGRTIRGEHFDNIWLVLGLSGCSLPSPRHRLALKDLADGRNTVAHGHSDPTSFGRTKATADVLSLIKHVDDVITHFLCELDTYLDNKRFKR